MIPDSQHAHIAGMRKPIHGNSLSVVIMNVGIAKRFLRMILKYVGDFQQGEKTMNERERKSIEWQRSEWLAGRPHHNAVTDQCTPDFSCCSPELLAPIEERQAYEEAGPAKRALFLMEWLGRMLRHQLGPDNVTKMVDGYCINGDAKKNGP